MRPSWGREIGVGKTSTGGTVGVHTGGSCHLDFLKRYRKSPKAMRTSAEAADLCGTVRNNVMRLHVYACLEGRKQKDKAFFYRAIAQLITRDRLPVFKRTAHDLVSSQ